MVLGRLASGLLGLASTAVLARLLSPSDFGLMAAAFVVLSLSNVIFDGAFGLHLVTKGHLRTADIRTTLAASLLLSGVVMLCVILTAPAVQSFFGFPGLALNLAVSSVIIPAKSVFSVAASMLQRLGKFGKLATASVLGQFVGYILVAVPMAFSGSGVWSLVAALVIASFIEAAAAATFARLPLSFAWDKQALLDIRTSGPFSASAVLNWIAITGSNTIIGHQMSAHGLGLYSRSWKLLDVITAATAAPMSKVLLPSFARLNEDVGRARSAFVRTLGVILPLFSVSSALAVVQAPIIVELTLGAKWMGAIPVAQVLFAALVPRCTYKVSENFAFALGSPKAAAARQGIYAILMVVGALMGVQYGIIGVAVSTSIAITIFYVFSMSYAVRIGRIGVGAVCGLHLSALLLAALVAGIDAAIISSLHDLPSFVKHALGCAGGGIAGSLAILCLPRLVLGHENAIAMRKILAPESVAGCRFRSGRSRSARVASSRVRSAKYSPTAIARPQVLLITRLKTQNAGNEALSKELIKYAIDSLPGAQVRILDRYPRYFEQFRIKDLGSSPVRSFDALAQSLIDRFKESDAPAAPPASMESVQLDRSGRELTGPLRRLKRKLAVRRRLAALGVIERDDVRVAVTACATSDLLIWNPAGELHPTGNVDQALQLLLMMRIAQLEGRRTAVINHSLEVADERLKAILSHVYRQFEYVGFRDARSVAVGEELGIPKDRVYEVPDLVFLASRRDGGKALPNVPELAIGFSINGLEAAAGFDEWDALFNGLRQLQRSFLFVSNAANHDLQWAYRLAAKYGGQVVDSQPDCQMLRDYYRRCDVVISSRLHSSILALCEGVPVVSIEPSIFKLTSIFQQMSYPIATERLQVAGWSDRVLANVKRCLSDHQSLAEAGRAAILAQCERIEVNLEPLRMLACGLETPRASRDQSRLPSQVIRVA
jgi:O-antigen/teichoic acid export membrane protein/polysaccharide pyruvyl transferase WcaK-like protein